MPRSARIIIPDEQTVYHVISRTALDGYPMGDYEKDYLVTLIQKFSALYFTEILGYCIMGNHFHLLIKMLPETDFTNEDIQKRHQHFYGEDKLLLEDQIPYFRQKWASLSGFIAEIKQTFSRFYNKRYGRRGFFWGGRFKSLIVEKGETLINCLAYIDLNPVRAGIVERPEDYRWNSIGYHLQTDNNDDFLSLDFGLKEFDVLDADERLRRYRRFLYETGAIDKGKGKQIDQEIVEKERKKEFKITRTDRFRHRTRYFTDSGIIGTKAFVDSNYKRFKHLFQSKNDKIPKRIGGLEGIYSMKRLTE